MEKIKNKYISQIETVSDINEHIRTLYNYSLECEHITEMGVRMVSSTWAFLFAKPKKLISYDILYHKNIEEVYFLSKEYGINFEFIEQDVLNCEIEKTDLLFIDTLHTYNQLINELNRHSTKVNKYIILHDTITFGFVDESIYSHASEIVKKTNNKQGLKNAIDEFLNSEIGKYWEIYKVYENNNGLTILKKTTNT